MRYLGRSNMKAKECLDLLSFESARHLLNEISLTAGANSLFDNICARSKSKGEKTSIVFVTTMWNFDIEALSPLVSGLTSPLFTRVPYQKATSFTCL